MCQKVVKSLEPKYLVGHGCISRGVPALTVSKSTWFQLYKFLFLKWVGPKRLLCSTGTGSGLAQ